MALYLLKLLVLTVFSFIIIYFYYFAFPVHQENFDWYISYIIIVWIIYWVYKYFQSLSLDNKVHFSPLKIFLYFILHLFILCILFFSYNNEPLWNSIILFFKILFYCSFPALITFIVIAFWRKILWNIKSFSEESWTFKFLLSLWVGFFSFIFLLTSIWMLGFYNLYTVFTILIWFSFYSYKELMSSFNSLTTNIFTFDNHNLTSNNIIKSLSLRLLTTEWLFIIATLILSVSLISIMRPFPIGWDDLWAYMNYPRLFANAWELSFLWWMNSWQTFTWIGYMFNSSTQAFFLNNVWGILSFIVLTLIVWELLKTSKKTFINIPLLIWTLFISMPMVVFQQAKDMKLDTGLFFISIITLYLLQIICWCC